MSLVELSVVIPAYNREGSIGRALESVLSQSVAPREILVVDDGSKDGTAASIHAFGDRVRYVYQENAGAAEARNRGVRDTNSEWIAFLDSDDFFLPGHLEKLCAAIEATDGRAAVYFANMKRSPADGGALLWDLCEFQCEEPHELIEDATGWVMLPRQPMMLQSSAFLRSRYLEVGGMIPELLSRHDTHLFFKLCLQVPACAVNFCGTEMTADDQSGGRVTEALGTRTPAYHRESALLYAEILRSFPKLPSFHRAELESRLSSAHIWLARHHMKERQLLQSGAHLAAATWARPGRVLTGLGRRIFGSRGPQP